MHSFFMQKFEVVVSLNKIDKIIYFFYHSARNIVILKLFNDIYK